MISIAFNLRTADNGFAVEMSEDPTKPTSLVLFGTYESALAYITGHLAYYKGMNKLTVDHVEKEASKTLTADTINNDAD